MKRLLLSAEVAESAAEIQEAAELIVAATEPWRDRLRAWLEVVTGQHLTDIGHREVDFIGQITPIWQVSPDRSDKRPLATPGVGRLTLGPTVADVTADVLAGCLSLASNSAPDLAWTLLRDARSLSAVHQYRRAVIDAATAAELAITLMMDARLEELDAKKREKIRKNCKSLGGKVEWLPKLGQPLPDGLYESLVDKRNDAVHEGHEVRPADCNTAIAASAAVVEMAYPLRALLGTRQW